jgi:acetoacetyl-CoA reductase
VVTTYSTPGKHADWQARMREQGFDIATYQCDVSNFDSCASMVKRVRDELGPVGILVNNAGITRDGRMQKMEKSAWDDVLRTNLDSVFNVTRQVLDDMCEANWGRVINISSINGQKGQFGQTNYSAAKAGVHGFSMALAQEVAKKGITVNTISPGYIGTEMVMAVKEEVRNQIIAGIPVGRLGKPEEIAALVAFIASDDASFMTGANIAMNGGQHMC